MEERQKWVRSQRDLRILFSDIDGTLINSRQHIPGRTREKILELDAKGIPFILVSARGPAGVEVIRRELGNRRPFICYSGGLILDADGSALYSKQMEVGLAVEIQGFLEREYPQICCNTYGGDLWVVKDDRNPWVVREEKITRGKSVAGDIREAFAQAGGIHKFLLMGEPDSISRAELVLRKHYPELSVLKSNDFYLEVMDGSVHKAAGVRYLCDHYRIPVEEAAAFGDGENDVGMLQAVGCGFAMGNAPEDVKRQVNYVTGSNEEEGIWEVIRELG